jgi:type I restriction enzyme S subunit
MNEGWERTTLGELTKWRSGGTPSKSKNEYWGGDIPWISASSMRGNRYSDSKLKVTELGLKNGTKLAQKNDILLLVRGSILHQKIQVGIATKDLSFNQDVKSLTVREDIDPWFILAWLRGNEWGLLNMVENTGIGAGKLDTTLLQNLPVNLPPLTEREKITSCFRSIDDKIHLLRQQNATLESMSQALFKSWFVDFDPVIDNALAAGRALPEALAVRVAKRRAVLDAGDYPVLPEGVRGLFPDSFVFSEGLGRWVPEGWEVKAVSDLVNTISETFRLKEVNEVIFLNTGDIQNGEFLHQEYSIASNLPGQAKKSIQKGDILYSEIRPKNKRFAYVDFDAQDYVVSTKLMVLRSTDIVDAKFIYHFLTQQNVIDRLQTLAESRSGTFPQITFDVLSTISLVLPVNKEIIEIFNKKCLFDQLAKTSAIRKKIATLTRLRDVLLPELISGRVGV